MYIFFHEKTPPHIIFIVKKVSDMGRKRGKLVNLISVYCPNRKCFRIKQFDKYGALAS